VEKIMQFSLTLEDSRSGINKKIADALAKEVNKILVKVVNNVRPPLKKLIYDTILSSEEVKSLNGGKLQSELGVPEANEKIIQIVKVWADSIDITLSPAQPLNGFIKAGFRITAIQSDYSDVLSQSEAIYSTASGQTIQWLEWLLLEGDRKIIKGYEIGVDVNNLSRTGLGQIMFETRKSGWGVPPEFAGFAGNNFVTRSLDSIEKKIEQLIVDNF
jgi:hypothetical protein